MIARCARLPSIPGLAGAAKDRSRCIRSVTHFYSGKPMHFYSGVDTPGCDYRGLVMARVSVVCFVISPNKNPGDAGVLLFESLSEQLYY